MQFSEFEEQIFSVDSVVHREFFEHPAITQAREKDPRSLRTIVRRAAEDLVLCGDVEEGINRLHYDPEAWSAIITLTVDAPLAPDDHSSAARRAFQATAVEPNALPFYPYCSYLLELCGELDRTEIAMPER